LNSPVLICPFFRSFEDVKYGIFSDIHGNLEALQAVLSRMDELGVERRVCLGDVVGYGPNPNECVQLVREKAHITILGNHDSVALGWEAAENFNFYARRAIEWTREVLTDDSVAFLKSLRYTESENGLCFVHSSPHSPADWYYVTDLEDAADSFNFFRERICFIGHTHFPVIVVKENEQSFRICDGLSYEPAPGERMLVNDGSVGQPRDRNPLASFAVCDSETGAVEIMRVPYDVTATQAKMQALDFADFLIRRLAEGR
jgi:diadenosine tetraphosphatase ApaH/serine/threonine PP2A family protein phosphatase